MKRRQRLKHAELSARSIIGAGVVVAVPTTGALVAAAPAMADPGAGTSLPVTAPTQTAASAAPSTTRPVLYFGSRGSAVKELQTQLKIEADGVFGAVTLAAVKAFQNSNGLVVDGVVGPLTWAELAPADATPTPTTPAPTPETPAPSSCTTNATTLRIGMTHPLAKILQTRLGLVVDGYYGPISRAAVIAFQAKNGLVQDGVVGPLTWAKLGCTDTGNTPAPTTPPTAPTTPPTAPTTPPTTPPTAPTTPPAPAIPSTTAAQVIAYAKTFLGVPYVWGGSTPAGFDCSGLVQYVYAKYGISMPRVSQQQQAYFPRTTNPQPGDLLFYGSPAYHVAIYLGDGMMLDAPHPGATVNVRAIYGTPSSYGRVFP